MELGYAVVIPTFVFLDSTLSPLERLLYGVLSIMSTYLGSCTATNEEIAKNLQFRTEGVVKQISEEALMHMLENLENRAYIHTEETERGRAIVVIYQKQDIKVSVKAQPKKAVEEMDTAKKILAYLSEACMVRGYRTGPYKETTANLSNIAARLAEGATYVEAISVINTKFQDPYFIENPKFLNPQTLFRPSKYEGYVTQTSSIKDVEKKIVTKRGLGLSNSPTQADDVAGESF
jgi:uncharacterized phage protein (TIGR02220 family)